MLAVTQLEVYVLARGRWTLHARYAGEDKREALWDAQKTEADTGFPAKVVRETFFPELNDSERITTYISPKAKKQIRGRVVQPVRQPPKIPAPVRQRRVAHLRQLTASQVMLRLIVAATFSLMAAAFMAVIVNWMLQRFSDIGISMSAATISMFVTYSWVAMFLLFFFSLFRSKLPLHRLLADLWQSSKAQAVAAQAKPVKAGKIKPKYDRANAPETLKEWQELRQLRGDPDIFSEAETAAAAKAAIEAATGTTPSVPVVPPEPPKLMEDKTLDELIARENAMQEKAAKTAREKAAKEKAVVKEKAEQDKKDAEKRDADVPLPPMLAEDENDFAHGELRRFIFSIVRPAAAAAMRDDPVARRGMALVITGAVDALAQRPEARGMHAGQLLTWGLAIAGLNEGVAAFFVASLAEHRALAANHPLIAAGENTMGTIIPVQNPDMRGFTDALSIALAAWRTPFGQPGQTVPEATPAAEQVAAPPELDASEGDAPESKAFEERAGEQQAERLEVMPVSAFMAPGRRPLVDVFLLTELRPPARHDDAIGDDARMAAHNERVRAALNAAGAVEVKHTGKGIFARFAEAGSAIAVAQELQRGLGQGIALALIGNDQAGEDPGLSPTLFLRAQSAIAGTADGQVMAEAHVAGEDRPAHQPTDLVVVKQMAPEPVAMEPVVA